MDSLNLDHFPNYVYPSGPHTTVFIYHAELGINGAHQDFANRDVEWVYTGLAKAQGGDTEDEASDAQGHSTCTASKAAGSIYGAAKDATLVVVKAPNLYEDSISELLGTIIDHILANGREGKSVVTISWNAEERYSASGFQRNRWWQTMDYDLKDLYRMDVPVFCSAGNEASGNQRTFSDTIPAAFALTYLSPYHNQIVAVSNCDSKGARWPSSQVAGLPIFAPGVEIECAGTGKKGLQVETGTSFCKSLPQITKVADRVCIANACSLSCTASGWRCRRNAGL